MDHDRVAHDLAILYMQLEIKEEKIIATSPSDDLNGFANEYAYLYNRFLEIVKD